MTAEQLGPTIIPDVSISKEGIQSASIGEAMIIVNFDPNINGENATDPKIAVVVEKKSKPSSKRIAGQRSIPIETRKVGESRIDNIRGGIAEICNDEMLGQVRANFFLVESGLGQTLCSGNVVGLSVLIYNGNISMPFTPINVEEVGFAGWISMNELLEAEDVREIAKDFIKTARDTGLIASALRDFKTRGLSTQLFPADFSINQFYAQRESTGIDVKFTL
nr:hypothetical protein [Candidatus Levybacteria bacterium]